MSELVVLPKDEFINIINHAATAAAKEATAYLPNGIPELMTKEQLITYLQCSSASINRWIKLKNLPVHYLGDSDPRFYKSEIDDWLKKNY